MDHCDVLEKHFKALISPNTIRVQFEDFLSINIKAAQDMQGREFMKFVLQQSPDHAVYPDFLRYNSFNTINNYSLCQIISVIPASSVDCERGFSALNLIKTNLRSRLRGEHLESLLRISAMNISLTELRKHEKILVAKWRCERRRRSGDKADELIEESDSEMTS